MSIHPNDVVSTLQYLGMLKYWKGKHLILIKQVCKVPFRDHPFTTYAKLCENLIFLTRVTLTYMCVSVDKKYQFFEKSCIKFCI